MFEPGAIVIVPSGQCGTVTARENDTEIQVRLRNGEIWTGPSNMCRSPADKADEDAAPVDVERVPPKKAKRKFGS